MKTFCCLLVALLSLTLYSCAPTPRLNCTSKNPEECKAELTQLAFNQIFQDGYAKMRVKIPQYIEWAKTEIAQTTDEAIRKDLEVYLADLERLVSVYDVHFTDYKTVADTYDDNKVFDKVSNQLREHYKKYFFEEKRELILFVVGSAKRVYYELYAQLRPIDLETFPDYKGLYETFNTDYEALYDDDLEKFVKNLFQSV